MSVIKTRMYGHYTLRASYRGKTISVVITDAEVFDWLDDESNKKKNLEAKRFCYNKIREKYTTLK